MTRRPHIEYPCAWSYRLIGASEASLREAVRDVLGAPAALTQGRASGRGRYVSATLTVQVRDEPHRLAVFEALAAHEAVVYVL